MRSFSIGFTIQGGENAVKEFGYHDWWLTVGPGQAWFAIALKSSIKSAKTITQQKLVRYFLASAKGQARFFLYSDYNINSRKRSRAAKP
jgi:hypothetical protein